MRQAHTGLGNGGSGYVHDGQKIPELDPELQLLVNHVDEPIDREELDLPQPHPIHLSIIEKLRNRFRHP